MPKKSLRGSIITLAVLSFVPFLMIALFSIDLGLLVLFRNQAQHIADMSALAAGSHLMKNLDNPNVIQAAKNAAIEVANLSPIPNLVDNFTLRNEDIEPGKAVFNFEDDNYVFTPTSDLSQINSIRVTTRIRPGLNMPAPSNPFFLVTALQQVIPALNIEQSALATVTFNNIVVAIDFSSSTTYKSYPPTAYCSDPDLDDERLRTFRFAATDAPDYSSCITTTPDDFAEYAAFMPQPITDMLKTFNDFFDNPSNKFLNSPYRIAALGFETDAYLLASASTSTILKFENDNVNNKDQIIDYFNFAISKWQEFAQSPHEGFPDPHADAWDRIIWPEQPPVNGEYFRFAFPGGLDLPNSGRTNIGVAVFTAINQFAEMQGSVGGSPNSNIILLTDGLNTCVERKFCLDNSGNVNPSKCTIAFDSPIICTDGVNTVSHEASVDSMFDAGLVARNYSGAVIYAIYFATEPGQECPSPFDPDNPANPQAFKDIKLMTDVNKGFAACANNISELRDILNNMPYTPSVRLYSTLSVNPAFVGGATTGHTTSPDPTAPDPTHPTSVTGTGPTSTDPTSPATTGTSITTTSTTTNPGSTNPTTTAPSTTDPTTTDNTSPTTTTTTGSTSPTTTTTTGTTSPTTTTTTGTTSPTTTTTTGTTSPTTTTTTGTTSPTTTTGTTSPTTTTTTSPTTTTGTTSPTTSTTTSPTTTTGTTNPTTATTTSPATTTTTTTATTNTTATSPTSTRPTTTTPTTTRPSSTTPTTTSPVTTQVTKNPGGSE